MSTQSLALLTAALGLLSLANKFLLASRLPKVASLIRVVCALSPADLASVVEELQGLWAAAAKAAAGTSTLILCLAFASHGCTPAERAAANTGGQIATTLAGDICQVVQQDDPTAPQWVTLACQAEGGAAVAVKVTVPFVTWLVAQAQTAPKSPPDAGSTSTPGAQ